MARTTVRIATRAAALAVGLAGALLLGGCGVGDPGDQGDRGEPGAPGEPAQGATAPEDDRGFDTEASVVPRSGMLDVEPVRIWHEHGTIDDRTMLVTFANQGPPCEVLDRVEVDQLDTRLTITLLHGRDPDADPGVTCDGPPDRVFDVEVPLPRPFEFEVDVLVNGGSTSDRVEVDEIVTPRPGMLDVAPVPWWYDYGRDLQHDLLVTFASQGPPCEVLDRVEVDETGSQPVVTLYQGRDPAADPADPCDGPTRVVGVVVPLPRDVMPPTPHDGPDGVHVLAGITAETGEGPIVNGGSLTDGP